MASSLPALLALCLVMMMMGTQAGVLEFGPVLLHITRRFPVSSYAFYGCYCGYGGRGWPVDEIDWCCHEHDCCYTAVSDKGCFPLTQSYEFSYSHRSITCDDPDLEGCARQTCECDRLLGHCFQENERYYSEYHRTNFFRFNCWGPWPSCIINE